MNAIHPGFERPDRTLPGLVLVITLAIAPLASPPRNAAASPADEPLARLRTLVGEWEGNYEWTGAIRGAGTMNVRYAQAARGTALVETLYADGEPIMMSVYHMDGEDLRLTHYCGAGNQPRMKAVRMDPGAGRFAFEMVDITNLASPGAGHVRAVELDLTDDDQPSIVFTYLEGGEESREHVSLRRVR